MKYSEQELETIKEEDFTTYFMCSLGEPPFLIDILTFVHKNIDFDKAETNAIIHKPQNGTELRMIPYDLLKEVKLRSKRQKDLFDIARLEEIRNTK
jgi:hypothetical protein